VLVDEFQDTDPLQVEIAALLTGAAKAPGAAGAAGFPAPEPARWVDREPLPGALFFVGDPKQSIYRFRRADLVIYDEARDWLERAARGGSASLAITANFRSRRGSRRS
jgi:ATP-dependent exoDNAse (exonuclease V) beta subunit